jgi:hypothetical protein
MFSTAGTPLTRGQWCPMGEPLLVSPGDLGTATATTALPKTPLARTLAPFPPDPSAQVMAFFSEPALPGEPWVWFSASLPAFFLDLEAVEEGGWVLVCNRECLQGGRR